MIDLNELYVYLRVVEQGGFAAAGRILGMPKSTVSRKISNLEDRLGFRLIQRSTRHFQVTEIGQNYYRHCQAMMAEVEAAENIIQLNHGEPSGTIRMGCSTFLLGFGLAPMLASFMQKHPKVDLYVKSFNRKVDVISEGYDLFLDLNFLPLDTRNLVVKQLAVCSQVLVGSPQLLSRYGALDQAIQAGELPGLEWERPLTASAWQLSDERGNKVEIEYKPRLVSDDLSTLKQALLDGVGIACLPEYLITDELARGSLVVVLPQWQPTEAVITVMFPSRRGLLPSVRAFVDFISEEFRSPWY
ncbi:LysR substrate-binding domain-containing protein [Pseudomonas sp. GD03858]|uniref:LysR substrate-binding domain-containing protein n=1 Tax=unclassified Pseudomonas TaxID=196821 RepID=UPI00244A4193|nr:MULTISPECIES: LysR substrate-binding domain-containing protein [unclassified Pseudomonas]MDH0645892.1 LysR substrate-binding domain-containing protein [Pseudomonas sp. GD03867]MDH0661500.1 LysR substrate-binding domain-containing protein [Pseudomonas sp. GD03858]